MEEPIHWKRPWSWEIEGRRRRRWQRLRWLNGITNSNGHEFEETPGDGKGQGDLACCSPWGCKESDTLLLRDLATEQQLFSCHRGTKPDCEGPVYMGVSSSVAHDSYATPWTVACQAPLSMRVPRQEYWSRLPSSSPRNLPNPGIEPTSPASPALVHGFFTTEPPENAQPLAFLHHSFS